MQNNNSTKKVWIIITLLIIVAGMVFLGVFGLGQSPDYKKSYEVRVSVDQNVNGSGEIVKDAAEKFFSDKGIKIASYATQSMDDGATFVYKIAQKADTDFSTEELKNSVQNALQAKEETKKVQKKNNYFPLIVGILILLGIAGTFAYNKSVFEETASKSESSSQEKDKDPEYKVGETIEFGNYPQEEDGTEKPIEWIVMKNEGNQVLLLSKYVLDAKPYNEGWEDVTWQTSDIRKWLNNEFYTTAFNKAEKAKIRTSLIKNEDNSMYGTSGGNDTPFEPCDWEEEY